MPPLNTPLSTGAAALLIIIDFSTKLSIPWTLGAPVHEAQLLSPESPQPHHH